MTDSLQDLQATQFFEQKIIDLAKVVYGDQDRIFIVVHLKTESFLNEKKKFKDENSLAVLVDISVGTLVVLQTSDTRKPLMSRRQATESLMTVLARKAYKSLNDKWKLSDIMKASETIIDEWQARYEINQNNADD